MVCGHLPTLNELSISFFRVIFWREKQAKLEPEAVRIVGENILLVAAANFEGIDLDKRLEFGSPAESIIQLAKHENFDLIVLGSRGLSSVKRYLLGSVSEDGSLQARCSVLIVG